MVGEKIFVACAPGLEIITAQEMRSLGFIPTNVAAAAVPGGVNAAELDYAVGGVETIISDTNHSDSDADTHRESVYRLNLSLRTASRVLVRLGEFYAAAFSELRKKAGRLDWEAYLLPGQPVALRVTCHKSRLYHSDAVAERVLGAIADRLGSPVPLARFDENAINKLPQLVVVRLLHDKVTISIDSSGEHMHRRGYRLAAAKAPLRENLAAGMLLASAWDRVSPLLDPFCGSGTIPIEAALLAKDLSPGRLRRFAFMDWPGFDQDLYERLLVNSCQSARKHEVYDRKVFNNREWDSPIGDPPDDRDPNALGMTPSAPVSDQIAAAFDKVPTILCSDRDAGAIAMAEANASRAGISDCIEFSCLAVSAVEPPAGPGWVITNPPYGLRVSAQKDLRNLYAQFGKVLRLKCPGWRYAILCNDERLFLNSGLHPKAHLSFENGGVPVTLYCGTVSD